MKPDPKSGVEELKNTPDPVPSSEVSLDNVISQPRSRNPTTLINVKHEPPAKGDDFYHIPGSSAVQSRKNSVTSQHSQQSEASVVSERLPQVTSSPNIATEALVGIVQTNQAILAQLNQQAERLKRLESQQGASIPFSQAFSTGISGHPFAPASMGAPPPVGRRAEDVARQAERFADLLGSSQAQADLLSCMGQTSHKVHPTPPHANAHTPHQTSLPGASQHESPYGHSFYPSFVDQAAVFNQALLNPGHQFVNGAIQIASMEQWLKKGLEEKTKLLSKGLTSWDTMYAFFRDEGMLAGPHRDTYLTLALRAKEVELLSGWECAKQYVKQVTDIKDRNRNRAPLRDRVGPMPTDGNFFPSGYDSATVMRSLMTHNRSLLAKVVKLEEANKKKPGPKRSGNNGQPSGRDTQDDTHIYYCDFHKKWYPDPNHTSDSCRAKLRAAKASPNGSKASQKGGASSD